MKTMNGMKNNFLQDTPKDIVTQTSNDIFFLDSNFVVAYLNEEDPRHERVSNFLESFLHQEKYLCLNSTVIHEVIHILSRIYYASEMLKIDAAKIHLSRKKRQEIFSSHSRNFLTATKPKHHFTPELVKVCKETLRTYNTKAIEKFLPFFTDCCILLHANRAQVELAFSLFTDIPLHSADAMIAASAIHHNTTDPVALITLDRDLCSLPDIPVYFFDAHTNEFTISKMKDPLHPTVLS